MTVISEDPHCACSERVNCVMVPGVSMTSLKIDTEASHSMNEMQGKSEIGEGFMLKIGEGFMLLDVYILVTWLYVYCNF